MCEVGVPNSVCFFGSRKHKGHLCAGDNGTIMSIHTYNDTITMENLLVTWEGFLRGKRHKKDVMEFELHLSENISALHRDLFHKTYIHGPFSGFLFPAPKPRRIIK